MATRETPTAHPANQYSPFILDTTHAPVLLISAGIGATPVLAMLHALVADRSTRPVWWVHGARNGSEHAFAAEADERAVMLVGGEGSIGGDIEGISLADLQAFYEKMPRQTADATPPQIDEQRGSNGFAIAPSNTQNGHALLLTAGELTRVMMLAAGQADDSERRHDILAPFAP